MSQACIAEPYCILLPANTDKVSKAVKIIDFFQVKFAVRSSGGHSPNPGWSSVPSGILLDLRRIVEVDLNAGKTVASTGPGARWGDVIDIIVLADGSVTNANAGDNSDLFWALKGGGPDFCIVKRYDLFIVPVRDIWYGWDAYSPDQAENILEAIVEWPLGGASDLKSTVAVTKHMAQTTFHKESVYCCISS
ncbi:hypothetical protein F4778DRAFT_779697 [Xylariomycetidae sp. FL2044]|nr:hypothetical protein F4778DRAFT_779697 [Xylariomycetidae sp. FL2044]